MNVAWSFFWPLFAIGVIAGGIAGSIGFRLPVVLLKDQLTTPAPVVGPEWRRRRWKALAIGFGAIVAATALWSGPLGAAGRFSTEVERTARQTLDAFEMNQVEAHLYHAPLTRRLHLSGTADDFQRGELVRIMGELPGVSTASWSGGGGSPLIAEGAIVAAIGYLVGLLLAYLFELRRRHNAQWNW